MGPPRGGALLSVRCPDGPNGSSPGPASTPSGPGLGTSSGRSSGPGPNTSPGRPGRLPLPSHAPQGVRATQSPRGPASRACQPIGGGLHGADQPLTPPYAQLPTTAQALTRGGSPSYRHRYIPPFQHKVDISLFTVAFVDNIVIKAKA